MSRALEPVPGPIDDVTFDALLKKLAPLGEPVALAVSGGPDSMALALCMKRWGRRDAVALIVDHGLRPESAVEAAQVRARLQQIGLRAEILRWRHDGIANRIHECARAARYRLLTEVCHEIGAKDLLVAHHREDQAETILMRLAKGSAIDGLAGMPAQSLRDGIRILRPFLGLSKQSLVATCEEAGMPFVADPGNKSEKFARGRLRAVMPLLADQGLTIDGLIELGARARESAEAIDAHARDFLREFCVLEIGGTVRIDRAALQRLPRGTALRVLAQCLRGVHDGAYPPPRAAMAAVLDSLFASGSATRSLQGCLIAAGGRHVMILREPAAAHQRLPITQGQSVLWDGRWKVSVARQTAENLTVAALGMPAHAVVDRLAPGLRRRIPQGRARASLPALWQGGLLHAIPSLEPDADLHMAYHTRAFPLV